MSGCQWLCLSKPPRRVFIDSPGRPANLDLKGLCTPTHVCGVILADHLRLKLGGFILEITRGHKNPWNRRNDKGGSCLALTGAESQEAVTQVKNVCTELSMRKLKHICGHDCCGSIYLLYPFHRCFSCLWLAQHRGRLLSHYWYHSLSACWLL